MLATSHKPVPNPQPLLFSKLTDISPHIRFACFVGGEKLVASFTHIEDTGIETLYHVSFSNGHKDRYVPGDAEVHDIFGRTRRPDAYEDAIFDDLCVLKTFLTTRQKELTCFPVYEEGGDRFNVWLSKRKETYHDVYYKGQYHFTLRKQGRWEVGTKREKGFVINQQLATVIFQHLDKHTPRS